MLNLNDFSFLSEIFKSWVSSLRPLALNLPFFYYYLMKTGRIHCQTNLQLWLELDDHDFQRHCTITIVAFKPHRKVYLRVNAKKKNIYIYIYLAKREPKYLDSAV